MLDQPPNKKIRGEQEFIGLIDECYRLKFIDDLSENSSEDLRKGISKIREILGQAKNSSDVPFGSTRFSSKITWGKCLYLMLESGQDSLPAVEVLNRISPGGGLL